MLHLVYFNTSRQIHKTLKNTSLPLCYDIAGHLYPYNLATHNAVSPCHPPCPTSSTTRCYPPLHRTHSAQYQAKRSSRTTGTATIKSNRIQHPPLFILRDPQAQPVHPCWQKAGMVFCACQAAGPGTLRVASHTLLICCCTLPPQANSPKPKYSSLGQNVSLQLHTSASRALALLACQPCLPSLHIAAQVRHGTQQQQSQEAGANQSGEVSVPPVVLHDD